MEKQTWFEKYKASVFSVGIMLLLLVAAVVCHLFGWKDAPFQFLAACLGAGVTVIITNLLLVEQTKQQAALQDKQIHAQEELQNQAKRMELRQIKETEQYKTKLLIYQEFLQKLFDAVKDFQLSDDEKLQLQFQTAFIAMHTKDEHVNKISKYTAAIVKGLCSEKKDNRTAYNVKELQEQLFNIVRCFQEELYDELQNNDELRAGAATEFANIFDSFESFGNDESLRISSDLNQGSNEDDLLIWNKLCERWNPEWNVVRVNEDGFRLERNEKCGAIEIGFWEGHYYIQAEYGGFVDFAKTMKRKYGGRRSYGTWWRHINDNGFYEIKQGEFLKKFNQNKSIQSIVSDWVDILVSDIDTFTPFANWWNKVKEKGTIDKYAQHWRFWIWAEESTNKFERFVCDYENEEYGNPFVDTYYDDNRIVFVLWNRSEDKDKFKKLIDKLNVSGTLKTIERDRRIIKTLPLASSDEEVAQCIEELIERINL